LRIVVDTSVLYAAAIRRGSVRRAFLRPGIEWVVPPATARELRAHAAEIAKELHRPRAEALEVITTLLAHVTEVQVRANDPEFRHAVALLMNRDISDAPFLAAALKVGAIGIWSLDKDFDGLFEVPRFTTSSVERLLAMTQPIPEEE